MKAKNIAIHLRKKVDDWLESIEDQNVRKLAADGTIVTGGCIASMLLGEKVNDYDLYFKDKQTALAIAEYYVAQMRGKIKYTGTGEDIPIYVRGDDERICIMVRSAGVASGDENSDYAFFEMDPDPARENQSEFIEATTSVLHEEETEAAEKKYKPIFVSTNAITLTDKVQIITRFYGKPREIHANYDFQHVTNYWCSWTGIVTLRKAALESLLTKELQVISNGSRYPFAALCRVRKFLGRGFHITAGELLKLSFAINDLDLNDFDVLVDQLIGVDFAYFIELLQFLREHRDEWEKEGKRIPTPYIMELIDKLV